MTVPAADPVPQADDALWLAGMLEMTQDFGRLAVFERDLRTGQGRWSAQMFRMVGLPVTDPAPSLEAAVVNVHPAERERVLRVWSDARTHVGTHEMRFRILGEAGAVRHIHARFDVRPGPDGLPARLLGVLVDDTETVEHLDAQAAEVEAERERVRDLAHRIELVIAAVGVGLWTIDIESDDLEWTPPMYRIYGVGRGEKPATMHELTERFVHPDDRALLRAQRKRAAAPGQGNLNFVFRIIRPDGEVRALSTWSRREISPNGRLTAYGVTMDVTEQQRTQQRLRDLDESALIAAESAGIGTWERDLITGVLHWSAQMYRLRGHSSESGLAPMEVQLATIDPEDHKALRAKLDAAETSGDDYEHEFRVTWPDGSLHWLASRGIARRDTSGRIVRLIGVNWDVTGAKRVEAALRDKESAERANRAKSAFLSRMSHELRTPLNAVIGFTQLLLHEDDHASPQRRRQRLAQVDSAGRHLLALIDDVLDVATIESDELKLESRPVALQAAFDDAAQWVREQARRAGVHLHVQPSAGRVLADARRVRQVVSNLLSNAIKYNRPHDGQVWLSATAERLDDGGAAWGIRVRDTGRGLAESQRAHLYEPFNRLGAERENIPGTGIGLTIVRHLVEHMGGRIDVVSEPGRGSEFIVRLPVDGAAAEVAEAIAALPVAASTAPPASMTAVLADEPVATPLTPPELSVLYVEDNPVNALLVEELCAMRPGIRLRIAPDGATGIAQAHQDPPDVALVDMQLPDMDGTDVLDRLRADDRLARCRAIALSASAMPEDVQAALARGFDDYWTKPIDVARFLTSLDALREAVVR